MKTIFIAAGHSNVDPGAVAPAVRDANKKIIKPERREADIAVEMRNMVSFYLSQAGVNHGLDGKGTQNLPLNQSAAAAKKYQIAVEFHCNAAASPTATGCETLSNDNDLRLANAICNAISSVFKIRNRGAKGESSGQHHRLAFVQAGGIIVELLFISNPSDVAKYDAYKWLCAKAIAEALIAEARL